MSQDQLAGDLANLNLEQNGPQVPHVAKKHRRPHRAYHPIGPGTPSMPGTPTMGTPQFNNSSAFNNGMPSDAASAGFTPVTQSPYPNMPMGTPTIGATGGQFYQQQQQQQMRGSPYAQNYEDNSTASHIIATQRWEDQCQYLQTTFETANNSIPPLPSSEFYCMDQGSSDPRLMHLSMYNVPEDEHLRSATKLPLGLTVQPFAPILPSEDIPVVGSTDNIILDDGSEEVKEPLRCKRCRTYINPGFKFGYDSSAICNICNVKMKIPMDDFNAIDPSGQRGNPTDKIELSKGSVDFLVPKIYNAVQNVDPVPLHYIFVIDVTLLANENGSAVAMIEAIKASIEYIKENQEKCKIAIMAFDNKLRFYNLRPDLEAAQEYIVNEVNDVFLPMYSGLFVNPLESENIINDTLKKIYEFVVGNKYCHTAQSCYGSALEAATIAIDTITGKQGGKIVCSLNSLPTIGNGNLSLKKDDAIKKHMKCDNEFYNKIAGKMLRSYISLDLYVTNGGFIDMVTVTKPAELTGGVVKYYPHIIANEDEYLLSKDMVEEISKIEGYQALLKVRSSSGLSVESYYLDSVEYGDRDPVFPSVTKDTTIDVLFKYDDKLKVGTDVHFQTALLYTDIHGVRKVRSINCNGGVSNNIVDIFKLINQDAVIRIIIKDIIRTLDVCDFVNIRKIIDEKIVDILTQYRALVSGNSSSQLVLPDSLKTLPLYLLAFEKSNLMKPNAQSTRGNERCFDLLKYGMFNPSKLNFKLYPQIIPFHILLEQEDLTFYDVNETMLQVKPTTIPNISVRNNHVSLENGGCYFIFNGESVYLWFNENTNRMLLHDLLAVDPELPINQISLFFGSLPETGTDINIKAANVIKYWCHVTSQTSLPLILLRPQVDQYYSSVSSELLCEDKSMNMVESYDNYLVYLHRRIQEKISKEDYIKAAQNGKNHEQFHQKFVQF
ncbi:SED5-binding protein 3 [Monosporozyma unispora]|nr:COPII coat Sec23p-Sfb3p heterodimer component [Kazachstania unispora]